MTGGGLLRDSNGKMVFALSNYYGVHTIILRSCRRVMGYICELNGVLIRRLLKVNLNWLLQLYEITKCRFGDTFICFETI